mgnify:CR=1 FL=1
MIQFIMAINGAVAEHITATRIAGKGKGEVCEYLVKVNRGGRKTDEFMVSHAYDDGGWRLCEIILKQTAIKKLNCDNLPPCYMQFQSNENSYCKTCAHAIKCNTDSNVTAEEAIKGLNALFGEWE